MVAFLFGGHQTDSLLVLVLTGVSMTQADVRALLSALGAIIADDHIVYTSGRHGSVYVNKDFLYPHTHVLTRLCNAMAERWIKTLAWSGMSYSVDVVVAPAVGGVILSTWIAHSLSLLTARQVLGVYAEKHAVAVPDPENLCRACFTQTGEFVLNRGYDRLVANRDVLVVEDVLTTGGSVRKVVEAVRQCGGRVVGVSVLCNRGNVTAHDVGDVPHLHSLVNFSLESWPEEECPLCASGVPINTTVGKGAEFLARHKQP